MERSTLSCKLPSAAKIQAKKVPHPDVFTEMDITSATVFSGFVSLSLSSFIPLHIGKRGTLSVNSVLLINLARFVNDLLNQDHMCESVNAAIFRKRTKTNKQKKIYCQTSVVFMTLGCCAKDTRNVTHIHLNSFCSK